MLFVIEGLDGAGKSTQVRKLREYLTERCGQIEYIHFPRYNAPVYGDLISRFLRGDFGSNEQVHPQLVALLYAEDRHGAGPLMKEKIAAGIPVLLDRYVYSNIAYQCAKVADASRKRALRDWIFNTEYGDFQLPVPDLNLYLDVPISFVEKSLNEARVGSDRNYLSGASDIHEASIAFQKAVRDVYLEQCAIDDKFIRVNCADEQGNMAPEDVIFERIKSVVDPVLSGR